MPRPRTAPSSDFIITKVTFRVAPIIVTIAELRAAENANRIAAALAWPERLR